MVFPFRYAQDGIVRRVPKARASSGVWGKIFVLGPPVISRAKLHKSKHEKKKTCNVL